ncbi:origin recognition complex subunit 2-domain-containing protein [Entophlyctis helioformis]|nr:origin recognition complex subunit 2-domain-containing protein [Entophlyctis helioformis]
MQLRNGRTASADGADGADMDDKENSSCRQPQTPVHGKPDAAASPTPSRKRPAPASPASPGDRTTTQQQQQPLGQSQPSTPSHDRVRRLKTGLTVDAASLSSPSKARVASPLRHSVTATGNAAGLDDMDAAWDEDMVSGHYAPPQLQQALREASRTPTSARAGRHASASASASTLAGGGHDRAASPSRGSPSLFAFQTNKSLDKFMSRLLSSADTAGANAGQDAQDNMDPLTAAATPTSGKHGKRIQELAGSETRVQTPAAVRAQRKQVADKRLSGQRAMTGLEAAAGSHSRYFDTLHRGFSKSATSNNTLAKLQTLEPKDFHAAMSGVVPKHELQKEQLAALHRQRFSQWIFELDAGFNLLFYGFGSKRQLLQDFAVECLAPDHPVLIVNGFFPSVTLKALIARLLADVVGHKGPAGTLQDQIALVVAYFARADREHDRLYIVVHNIDGAHLRNDKTQAGLALLASAANIHMVASVDHINAAMMWDTVKLTRFNWAWQDATTFVPYRGVIYVLRSLTTNARKIFRILASYQVQAATVDGGDGVGGDGDDDGDDDGDGRERAGKPRGGTADHGLTFQRFFQKAHEQFLVSNELTFRTQLTEFRDHQIIRGRRGGDGTEVLHIPLQADVLQELLEQIE